MKSKVLSVYESAKDILKSERVRKYGAVIIGICVCVALGWYLCCKANANVVTVEKTVTEEVVKEVPVEVKGATKVVYVEKQSTSDADVEIHNEKPAVIVEYNGEKTKLDTLDNETQKFEKGKLQVESSSSVNLDVTPIVDREVKIATDKQKAEDKVEQEKAVKDEHKKSNKRAVENAAGGVGVGLLLGLLL